MPFIDYATRRGMEKGLEQGRQEGLREGKQEGLREGFLVGINLSLKRRFPAQASQLLTEIRQVADAQKLEAILNAIENAATPDELRRLWS
jgi:predicted transposase YdaD